MTFGAASWLLPEETAEELMLKITSNEGSNLRGIVEKIGEFMGRKNG